MRVRVNDRVEECWLVSQSGPWVTVRRTTKGRDFRVKATDMDRENRWKVTEEDS